MNHNLRKKIIKHKWIVKIINMLYRAKNENHFINIVEERRLLSIFDYKKLTEPIPYSPKDIVIDNNFYGLSHCLKKYMGWNISTSLDATIEHGVFFGNLVREDDRLYSVKSIVTFGSRRVKHLESGGINKEIIPIGPYIHYAQSILPQDEFQRVKRELGRVLLVFPSHGIIGVDANFNNDSFINEIERVKRDFDTVLVSLYWTDVSNQLLVSKYEDLGYRIVTSGHRFDLNFLSRQRSIIELADYTISNKLGTHVGYCIYLNKPHYIFSQKVEYVAQSRQLSKHLEASRSIDQHTTYLEELEEVTSFFNEDLRAITDEQMKIVEEIWGLSRVKTPEELNIALK